MATKVYTILKSSYNEDNEAFVENLFFANSSSMDALKTWFRKILFANDVKRAWLPDKENDKNIFYIEYNQNYESEFHHGFSIQVLNLDTHEQYFVTNSRDKALRSTMDSIISDLLRDRNKLVR